MKNKKLAAGIGVGLLILLVLIFGLRDIQRRNCLACFGPVGFPIFAVFHAFSRIRKNRRFENHGLLRGVAP